MPHRLTILCLSVAGLSVMSGWRASSVSLAPIEVTLTEGTNVAAHLSPDGSTLAMDLVGRIWTLPVGGGTALALTDPFGDARQPQWSPDGQRIAFQAYWDGDYDIWTVSADGSELEQVTNGPYDDREPTWSPDGRRILFSSDRGGTYDIWSVDLSSGQLEALTSAPGNEYTPHVSPDGSSVAYAVDGQAGGIAIQDGSGSVRMIASGGGAHYAPTWNSDGAALAWVHIDEGRSGLYVGSAEGARGDVADSGAQRVTELDDDVFPFRASWSTSGELLYTADGQIMRAADGGAGEARPIAFSAVVTLDRPSYRKRLRSFDASAPARVRGIISPSASPSGDEIAFVALGDLWRMPVGESPIQLTDDSFIEIDPAWSPDGRALAYGSDRDGQTDLYVHDVATGSERKLTTTGGSMPVWSPDGRSIAYAGGGRDGGIRVVDIESGADRLVRGGLNSPGRVTWSPDGSTLVVAALDRYSTRFREGVNRPLSIQIQPVISEDGDGGSMQTPERWLDFPAHASFASRGTDGPVWSPDGRTMAYVASGVLWSMPVGPEGDPVGPPVRLNNERSSDPSWSSDGRTLFYLANDRMRRLDVRSARVTDVDIPLQWEREVAHDRYVVHAGRLFDGVTSELRRNVDVVIDGNRIVRVVDHDTQLHSRRVVDASDRVVAPGLIEMHMHGVMAQGSHLGRQWLSFGVTSVRTPSADPFEMAEARESDAIGRRLEPRMFGTGNTIDGSRVYYAGAPALTSPGQIELELAQASDLDFDLVKTYVRLSDEMQARVIEDAHAMGMPVTSHELYPAVSVGADGVEHVKGTSRRGYSTKVSELNRSYDDVIELLGRSGMTITPTIGIYGAYGLLAQDDPTLFDDDRVRAFVPDAAAAARRGGDLETQRRLVRAMASLGRRVVERGGTVVVGTDTPIIPAGLALVAEMQALVQYGGMSEIDVLRATTSISARAMGYENELGSVREGMLADLIILGSDPLEDIRAIRDVRMVIEDGAIHTVDQLIGG